MALDLSKLATPAQARAAERAFAAEDKAMGAPLLAQAKLSGVPETDADYLAIASNWVKALGRKCEVEDLDDEPAVFVNHLIKGAWVYLRDYRGDFDFLLDVRQRLSKGAPGRRVLGYPNTRQSKGILNCLRADLARQSAQSKTPQNGAVSAPQGPARMAVEDAGVYVLPDGTVCRAQANKEKTKVYAKRWTPARHLDRLMEAGQHEHGSYVYEPGLIEQVVREGRRMTLAEAKEWSVRIGKCIRCGRTLTDGKSVEAGLGPVCIKWFQGA